MKQYRRELGGTIETSTLQVLTCMYNHPDRGLTAGQDISFPGGPHTDDDLDLIASEGWVEWNPPTPDPQPQYEPSEADIVAALNILNADKIVALDDEAALAVKALFSTWKSYLEKQENKKSTDPDVIIPQGVRLYHDDRLWKARQTHVVQADWRPDVVPALFTEITLEAGTMESPIEYNNNMELFKDIYYIQDGVLYQCTQSTGQPVYHPLCQLIGLFVRPVNN